MSERVIFAAEVRVQTVLLSLALSHEAGDLPTTDVNLSPQLQSTCAQRSDFAEQLLGWVDRRRYWVAMIVVLVYLTGYNGQWRVGDDSAGYVNIAQSLLAGGTLEDHDEALHRYAGTPWMIAAAFKLGGSGAFWLADAFVLGLALATVVLVYRTLRLHDSRPVAVLVAAMFALTAHFYRHAYELLADLPFLFGLMLFLAGYEYLMMRSTPARCGAGAGAKHRLATGAIHVASMLAGLGVMLVTRRTALIFVASLFVACLWQLARQPHRHKRMVLTGLLTAALGITGAWMLLDPRGAGAYARDLMLPTLGRYTTGETLARSLAYFVQIFEGDAGEAVFGLELGPGLSTVAAIAVLAAGVALVRQRMLWGGFIVMLLLAMIVHMPDVRYFVAILPLLAYGWWRAAVALSRRFDRKHHAIVLLLMLFLWCGPNMVRVGKVVIEQRRTPFLEHYNRGKYAALKAMSDRVRALTDPKDIVLTDSSGVIRYYSERRAVNWKLLNRWTRSDDPMLALLREHPQRVFVIEPVRGALRQRMADDLQLEPGPVVATVPRYPSEKPLQLRQMQRIRGGTAPPR